MTKHAHAEAFKLMSYACDCGHRETIWNSRDGVTPFGTKCSSCGELSLRHVEWQSDVYAPEHRLHAGQRFWRNGTPDEAEAILRRRFERMKDTYPITTDLADKMIAEARQGAEEFRTGWPTLDRHAD